MSQFGMQMTGTARKRSAQPDVYTGLLAIATAFLAAACVVMYLAGSKVGLNGSAFGIQPVGKIQLPK